MPTIVFFGALNMMTSKLLNTYPSQEKADFKISERETRWEKKSMSYPRHIKNICIAKQTLKFGRIWAKERLVIQIFFWCAKKVLLMVVMLLMLLIHHTSYSSTSYQEHYTSYIIPGTSYIIHHTSYIIHHTSCIIHHTSYNIHHTAGVFS